jgi:plastocyanin
MSHRLSGKVCIINSHQSYSVLTREPLVVPLGATVTWAMRDTFEIHTVTFTSGEKPPQFAVPEQQPSGAPKVLLNPKAMTPTNTTRYDGTGYVNSGLLFPPGNAGKLPSSFSLTFTKPGRFDYWCLVHAEAGCARYHSSMVWTVSSYSARSAMPSRFPAK